MYFDRFCRQCKFSFLSNVGKANCSAKTGSPSTTTGHRLIWSQEIRGPLHRNNNTIDVFKYKPISEWTKELSGNLTKLKIDLHKGKGTNNGNDSDIKNGGYRIVPDDRKRERVVWQMPETFGLRDPSSVPAWAIAFILYGLVLIMVGIILLIY